MLSVRERLERLRQLAHDAPSESVWAAVLAVLDGAHPQLLEYVAPHLDRWPAALRHHHGVPDERPLPGWWPLVRSLSLRETRFDGPEHVAATLSVAEDVSRLDLSLCGLHAPELLAAVAQSLPNGLCMLDLSANRLSSDGVAALAATPGSASITELRLAGTGLDATEISRLITWDCLDTIRTLDLGGCTLRGTAVQRLGSSRSLRHLTHLSLAASDLRDPALTALCGGRALTGLVEIDLRDNHVFGESLGALARVAGGTLQTLNLSGNPAVTLADLSSFPSLSTLRLSACGLDKRRTSTLSDCVMPSLRTLDLSDNPLTDAGCAALAAGPLLALVESLDVSGCALRGLRLPALLQHAGFTSLNLADNTLRSAAVRHLAEWSGVTALRQLDLRQNLLRDADAALLGAVLGDGCLAHLAVSSNYLEDPGALALVRSARTPHLHSLVLGGRITPAVLAALLETYCHGLDELVLEEEDAVPVHDWGPAAVALSRSPCFPVLKRAALPRFDVDTGVALLRGPLPAVRAILRGCTADWLRALAARLGVSVRLHSTVDELTERLLAVS